MPGIARAQLGRQYFRLFHHDSFFTDQLPGRRHHGGRASGTAARRSPSRRSCVRMPTSSGSPRSSASAWGSPRCRASARGWLAVLLAFVAYNLALFFLLHVKTRYRIPFLPVLDLLAGVGVAALAGQGALWRLAPAAGGGPRRRRSCWCSRSRQDPRTMPVAIAGMHRAGTSMVARVLRICGLDLGADEHFAPAAPDNTEGYWEDLRFVAWNERILETFGGAWDVVPSFAAGWTSRPAPFARSRGGRSAGRRARRALGLEGPAHQPDRAVLARASAGAALRGVRPPPASRSRRPCAPAATRPSATACASGRRTTARWTKRPASATRIVTHYDSYFADAPAEIDRVLGFLGLDAVSPSLRKAAAESASDRGAPPAPRESRPGPPDARGEAALRVALRAQRSRPRARASPGRAGGRGRQPARGRSRRSAYPSWSAIVWPPATRKLATLKALLTAREEELASIRPVLARARRGARVGQVRTRGPGRRAGERRGPCWRRASRSSWRSRSGGADGG